MTKCQKILNKGRLVRIESTDNPEVILCIINSTTYGFVNIHTRKVVHPSEALQAGNRPLSEKFSKN